MATFYKDFGKEAKDLLTKQVAEGKAGKDEKNFPDPIWKAESKLKVKGANKVVVNPVADSKGVTANVEFSCCDGMKGKINVKPVLGEWKPTASYECCGRKVEATTKSFDAWKNVEVTYEDKQKCYAAIVKVAVDDKATTANVEAAAPVIPDVSVGGSLAVPLTGDNKFNLDKWSAGLRYTPCKATVAGLSLSALNSVDVFAVSNIPGFELEGKPVQAGGIVTVKKDKNWGAVVGATGKVPMCPCGSNWKVKIDTLQNVSLTQMVDCSGWKLSWTFDVVKRAIGFTATLE